MIRATPTGQTLVEYGLIITLIAVAAILSVQTIGEQLDQTFFHTGYHIRAVTSTGANNQDGG